MYSSKYIRENWRGDKKMMETYIAMHKFSDVLSTLGSKLSSMLNDCGWIFIKGDGNFNRYKRYQKCEEYRHLMAGAVMGIGVGDEFNIDVVKYAFELLEDISDLMLDSKEFSEMEASKVAKDYKKSITYFKSIIKKCSK